MPKPKGDFLPGTLDLLILRTLAATSMHGYGIAQHIQRLSADVLRVEEGSLYPALQRLETQGAVRSAWRQTPTGRRARYYELTRLGRKRLEAELDAFDRLVAGIHGVLKPTEA